MKHPDKISKAPLLFDNEVMSIKEFYEKYKDELQGVIYKEGQTNATVSPFNACPRSDGAAVIIVTTEQKAKELNLPILAELKGWALYGVNPAQMGIAPAYSTGKLLKDLNLNFKDLDLIELHEAFAATCLTIFKLGEKDFQHQWRKNWEEGKVNRNGGTLALGHPLAATGTRIILNLAYEMKRDPSIDLGMAAACAAGGIGGSIVLKRYP
jgi:acetyl-CoA C-acetyltransferase